MAGENESSSAARAGQAGERDWKREYFALQGRMVGLVRLWCEDVGELSADDPQHTASLLLCVQQLATAIFCTCNGSGHAPSGEALP